MFCTTELIPDPDCTHREAAPAGGELHSRSRTQLGLPDNVSTLRYFQASQSKTLFIVLVPFCVSAAVVEAFS